MHHRSPVSSLGLYLVASIVSLALLGGALYLYADQFNRDIRVTRTELQGIELIDGLKDVMINIQRIRGLKEIALNGGRSVAPRVQGLVERTTVMLDDLYDDPLSARFDVRGLLVRLRDDVGRYGPLGSGDDSFEHLTATIALIYQQTVRRVAQRSSLIQDAEADTHALADLLVNHLHRMVERVGQLRGRFSGYLAARATGAPAPTTTRETIRIHKALVENSHAELQQHWQYMVTSFPALEDLLWNRVEEAEWRVEEMLQRTHSGEAIEATEYFALGSRVIEGWCAVCNAAIGELKRRLGQRIERLRQQRSKGVAALVLAVAVLLAALTWFYHRNRLAFAELSAQHREVERLSVTDALTGLYNRRHLDEVYDRERRRLHREGSGMAFGMLDVDFFKRYNDHYGHLAGDETLRRVADALEAAMQRAGDYVFRLGGEEFCFYHPADTCDEAVATGERLRGAVAALGVPHARSPEAGVVTVSVGVCFARRPLDRDLDAAMRCADAALYAAKDAGRNRVSFGDG